MSLESDDYDPMYFNPSSHVPTIESYDGGYDCPIHRDELDPEYYVTWNENFPFMRYTDPSKYLDQMYSNARHTVQRNAGTTDIFISVLRAYVTCSMCPPYDNSVVIMQDAMCPRCGGDMLILKYDELDRVRFLYQYNFFTHCVQESTDAVLCGDEMVRLNKITGSAESCDKLFNYCKIYGIMLQSKLCNIYFAYNFKRERDYAYSLIISKNNISDDILMMTRGVDTWYCKSSSK
jgi:hypothetical protein